MAPNNAQAPSRPQPMLGPLTLPCGCLCRAWPVCAGAGELHSLAATRPFHSAATGLPPTSRHAAGLGYRSAAGSALGRWLAGWSWGWRGYGSGWRANCCQGLRAGLQPRGAVWWAMAGWSCCLASCALEWTACMAGSNVCRAPAACWVMRWAAGMKLLGFARARSLDRPATLAGTGHGAFSFQLVAAGWPSAWVAGSKGRSHRQERPRTAEPTARRAVAGGQLEREQVVEVERQSSSRPAQHAHRHRGACGRGAAVDRVAKERQSDAVQELAIPTCRRSICSTPPRRQETVTPESLEMTSRLIEKKLRDFGVEVTSWPPPGPVITRYEIEPATGVKGSQIVNLAKDLARSLSLVSIRVVETIPGKNFMALELPNARRQTIKLSEILGSQVYADAASLLTMGLGKGHRRRPSWPTWPRCRTAWSPAPPAQASRSASTR